MRTAIWLLMTFVMAYIYQTTEVDLYGIPLLALVTISFFLCLVGDVKEVLK